MQAQVPNPLLLIAELTYKCPLHCPYCSNPLNIGDASYNDEISTEDWVRVIHEAGELGVLQLALTGGEPLVRKDCEELCAASKEAGLYSSLITAGTPFTRKRASPCARRGSSTSRSASRTATRSSPTGSPAPRRTRGRSRRRISPASSASRSRSTSSSTGRTSTGSSRSSSSARISAHGGSSSPTRSTPGGPRSTARR